MLKHIHVTLLMSHTSSMSISSHTITTIVMLIRTSRSNTHIRDITWNTVHVIPTSLSTDSGQTLVNRTECIQLEWDIRVSRANMDASTGLSVV